MIQGQMATNTYISLIFPPKKIPNIRILHISLIYSTNVDQWLILIPGMVNSIVYVSHG